MFGSGTVEIVFGSEIKEGGDGDKFVIYEPELLGKYVIIKSGGYELYLDIQQFIPCVLMSQMSISAPEEALKAQAVVIRTYILKYMEDNAPESATLADKLEFYADDIGLTYYGFGELQKIWGKDFYENYNMLNGIVADTGTQVITYNGELVVPFFHTASAGQTRDGEEVFGSEKYAYLSPVSSRDGSDNGDYESKMTYTVSEILERLDISEDDEREESDDFISVTKTCSSGYVLEVAVYGYTFSGSDIRDALNLKSDCFSFETDEGNVIVTTKGAGHGFGLSIQGAVNMAEDGGSYEEILNYYYQNIELKNE